MGRKQVSDTGREDREMSELETTEKNTYKWHSLRANECSTRVTWIFGQYKKPFSDVGVI